jgi:hypothetical protein
MSRMSVIGTWIVKMTLVMTRLTPNHLHLTLTRKVKVFWMGTGTGTGMEMGMEKRKATEKKTKPADAGGTPSSDVHVRLNLRH